MNQEDLPPVISTFSPVARKLLLYEMPANVGRINGMFSLMELSIEHLTTTQTTLAHRPLTHSCAELRQYMMHCRHQLVELQASINELSKQLPPSSELQATH